MISSKVGASILLCLFPRQYDARTGPVVPWLEERFATQVPYGQQTHANRQPERDEAEQQGGHDYGTRRHSQAGVHCT
jgi:hypothetical protein